VLGGGCTRRDRVPRFAEYYGDTVGLLAQIDVTLSGGSAWLSAATASGGLHRTDPVVEIYSGETYDAPRAGGVGTAARRRAGRPSRWRRARPTTSWHRPVRPCAHPEIKPVKILKTPGGDTVVDLGQNMVGWVRLKAAGRRVRHHAPARRVLDGENFYTEPAGREATLRYTLKGGGPGASRTSRS
jgi:alpha-L-rhamnosidase